MKKSSILLLLTFSTLFISCDAYNSMTSNYYKNSCRNEAVKIAYYDSEEGKYIDDKAMFLNPKGLDVSKKENNWLRKKMKYYLGLTSYGVYYEVSPYSRVSYKFATYCY